MLREISEFFPPGTQMKSPGGLSIDLEKVAAVEAMGGSESESYLTIHFVGRDKVTCHFYRSVNGAAPDTYYMKQAIEAAINGHEPPSAYLPVADTIQVGDRVEIGSSGSVVRARRNENVQNTWIADRDYVTNSSMNVPGSVVKAGR